MAINYDYIKNKLLSVTKLTPRQRIRPGLAPVRRSLVSERTQKVPRSCHTAPTKAHSTANQHS